MDHVAQAEKRIYAQYRDKPKAVAWLTITAEIANQFEAAFEDICQSYDIDTANSEQLNIIGRLVDISRFYGASSEALTDEIYRLILKSKIWKNNSDATIDSIIQGVAFIIGVDNIRLIDNEDMTFSIEFFSSLTDLQRTAITEFDIIPRPQGVRFLGFEELTNTARFGGAGDQFGRVQFGRFFGG